MFILPVSCFTSTLYNAVMLFMNKAFLHLFVMDVFRNKQNVVVFTISSYMLCEEHDNANNRAAEASLQVSLVDYALNRITKCLSWQFATNKGNLEGISSMKLAYTGCNRRNVRDFGRVFLRSNYTDITQNTYIQS